MKIAGKIEVLFVADFGPIVREITTSRKLYGEALGIPFQRGEWLGIFIPKPFRAQKLSPCGLFLKRRILVLVMTRGQKTFLSHKRGWSSTFRTWKSQRQLLNRRDIEFLSRTRKSLGAILAYSWQIT